MIQLVKPTAEYKDSFIEAVKEAQAEGNVDGFSIRDFTGDFEVFLKKVQDEEKGINLPEGYVSHSVFWMVDGDEFIGSADVRHRLNDHLMKIGGNIGYSIRSSKRRMGYGTKLLELTLKEAKKLGIDNFLLTCDDTNIGSIKVIENNGGVLENKIEHEGTLKRRYWIDDR